MAEQDPFAFFGSPRPVYRFRMKQTSGCVLEIVTKFGGQPQWIDKPQWPLSASSGRKMAFFGQVKFDQKVFPGLDGRCAYIFLSEQTDEIEYWDLEDPEDGETAVIIQPNSTSITIPFIAESTGPTLSTNEYIADGVYYVEQPGELSDEEYNQEVSTNRIGGLISNIHCSPKLKPGWVVLLHTTATTSSVSLPGFGPDMYVLMKEDGSVAEIQIDNL